MSRARALIEAELREAPDLKKLILDAEVEEFTTKASREVGPGVLVPKKVWDAIKVAALKGDFG